MQEVNPGVGGQIREVTLCIYVWGPLGTILRLHGLVLVRERKGVEQDKVI